MSRARAVESALVDLLGALRAAAPESGMPREAIDGADAALRVPAEHIDPDELRMVARFTIHEGDVVVLTHPRTVAPSDRERLLAGARAELPSGVRVLLLEEGVGIAILAPSQLPAPRPHV